MASCNWQKRKGSGDAKSVFRHCDKDERLKAEHSNKDINKAFTGLNMSFGAYRNGYKAICAAYDERITELDNREGANKRKDRVTLCALNIPAPENITDTEAQEWCTETYKVLQYFFGDNLLGGTAHFDERHEYIDARTKETRESRVHLHAQVIPEVNGKLQAKTVMSRKNMIMLNKAVEEMTKEKFPNAVFMTGEAYSDDKSVEELKRDSEQAKAILEKAEQEAEAIRRDAETSVKSILSNAQQKADEITGEAKKRLTEANETLTEAKNKRKQADDSLKEASEKLEAIKDAEKDINFAVNEAKRLVTDKALQDFMRNVEKEVKREFENVNYKSGRNGWEVYGDTILRGLRNAGGMINLISPSSTYQSFVEKPLVQAKEKIQSARPLPNVRYKEQSDKEMEF